MAHDESEGPQDGQDNSGGGVSPPLAAGASFPVVGIGASAGGLQAFQEFFSALPARPDMAFVLVQHLSPDHESALAELVQSRTEMRVTQVADHPDVEPNRVYVIPPGKHLEIEDGHLQLVDAQRDRGRPAAVDHFFRTLAEDMGERAVCIVLSGTGSDGSLGLKAVKERTGLTMAQAPKDAEYPGMPKSAIGTDLVDVVGTAAELAERLVEIRRSPQKVEVPETETESLPETEHQALQAIFAHLRRRTAHDFTNYKRSTILRRLARRLQVTGQPDLPSYAAYLRARPEEVHALLRDFLISVTQFFRDDDAFEVFEREAVPALFAGKGPQDQVRVWVAGCATGEEAYSIAMLLCEYKDGLEDGPDVQVFATDIDEEALARARDGHYATVAAADVSPNRLRRFFDVEKDGVRVKAELRQMVLFARHNLISDPPFSRLDLVTCRNVLIYLNRAVQTRVFATFHYALHPEGLLFLGSAEGPDALSKGFAAVDKKARLYRRQPTTGPDRLPQLVGGDGHRGHLPARPRPADPPREGLVERYRDWTLDRYAPPRLLVDEHYDVTHVFGEAGGYLRDREGPVTQNVVDKVVPAFRVDLRGALFRAFSKGEPTDTPFQRVDVGGDERVVRLHVGPVGGPAAQDGLAEVVFVELDPASVAALDADVVDRGDADGDHDDPAVARLEDELKRTRARLQVTVEESETSNEELKASNEELQSINEELQSTTEELETSKEELQSTNEELQTVNQELKNKLDELVRSNSDLQNLIASTEVGTVFLDRSLHLKRYTPRAVDVFHMIPSDVGRPFEHLTHRLLKDGIVDDARRVLDTLAPEEAEVEGADGEWYLVRMTPYRTTDDRIDGVVITFVDVTDLREARDEARRRAAQQAAVAEIGRVALGADLEDVFETACQRAADVLEADFAKVLRHDADAEHLALEAGIGWHPGLVGSATVPDDEDSQGGFTLAHDEVVVVPELDAEDRFQGPDLLTTHGVQSGISVSIPGGDEPWGVFGIHSRDTQMFSEGDREFVGALANLLGEAIRRDSDQGTIRQQLSEIEAVYGTAPVGLAFMDRDLRYRRINQRLADINGLPVEDHIGKQGKELFPLLADAVQPVLEQIIETGEPVEDLEFRGATLRDPDDERDWLCSYVPEVGVDGAVEGVSVVVRDVTNLRDNERRLSAVAEHLRLTLDAARLGTFRYVFEDDHVEFDDRFQNLFGVGPESSSDEVLAWVVPEDQGAIRRALDRALDPTDPDDDYDVENGLLVEGHTPSWISVRARVSFDGEGPDRTPRELFGVALDVTDLRRVTAELRELTNDLEARVEERTAEVRRLAIELTHAEQSERRRIATVLHDDLQQMLHGIQIKMVLLSRALPETSPASRGLLEEVDGLVERATQAARTLSVDLSPPVLDGEGFGQALQWLAHRVHDAHSLEVTLDGDLALEVAPDVRVFLLRAVRELLFNVVKHAGVLEAEVSVAAAPEGIRIEVSDRGNGFDPDTASSGFGVRSLQERLRLMGGGLEVESVVGDGARFVITSPIRVGGAS